MLPKLVVAGVMVALYRGVFKGAVHPLDLAARSVSQARRCKPRSVLAWCRGQQSGCGACCRGSGACPRTSLVGGAGEQVMQLVPDQHRDRAQICRPGRLRRRSRRWVVKRTFAQLNHNFQLARDFEHTIRSATAFLYAAAFRLPVRRSARYA